MLYVIFMRFDHNMPRGVHVARFASPIFIYWKSLRDLIDDAFGGFPFHSRLRKLASIITRELPTNTEPPLVFSTLVLVSFGAKKPKY